MVRVLSLVAMAAAAVAAAVAPAAAVPAAALQRPIPGGGPAAAASAASVMATLRGGAAVHAQGVAGLDLREMALAALEPVWEAYQAGLLDPVIDAFKAGKLDDQIPTEEEVLRALEQVMELLQKVVPKAYELLDEVKAGKHDDFLADAKKGSLEEFLSKVGEELLS